MFFAVESGLASSVVAIFLVNDPNRGWEQKQYKLRVEETKQLLDRVNAVNIHLCTIYTPTDNIETQYDNNNITNFTTYLCNV